MKVFFANVVLAAMATSLEGRKKRFRSIILKQIPTMS